MADQPIIFSGPMVQALLAGRKTQTRRLIPARLQERYDNYDDFCQNVSAGVPTSRQWEREFFLEHLPYAPGDRIWVKEDLICATEPLAQASGFADVVCHAESGEPALRNGDMVDWPWQREKLNARYCPRWASRLTLTVTDVRVQRLQEIGEADAMAEGLETEPSPLGISTYYCFGGISYSHARPAFQALWNSIHGPDAWDSNPWVVALTFTVEQRNIDAGAA